MTTTPLLTEADEGKLIGTNMSLNPEDWTWKEIADLVEETHRLCSQRAEERIKEEVEKALNTLIVDFHDLYHAVGKVNIWRINNPDFYRKRFGCVNVVPHQSSLRSGVAHTLQPSPKGSGRSG